MRRRAKLVRGSSRSSDWIPACVVFMPMLPGYEAIRDVVRRSVRSAGASLLRLEEVVADSAWQLWVVDAVTVGDLILVDVTDNNPHVMYELGVAQANCLPAIVIINRRNPRIPAMLSGYSYFAYDDTCLDLFAERLTDALRIAINRLSRRRRVHANPVAGWHDHDYLKAVLLLRRFSEAFPVVAEEASREEFLTRMQVADRRDEVVYSDDTAAVIAAHLLARIIHNSDKVCVMDALWSWVRALS